MNNQIDDPAPRPRPVVLTILDGWGYREAAPDNAISNARTANYDRLLAECAHGLLQTSGDDVGLPEGQMGNSEVGHLNIGAGRVVLQELPRISKSIADGTLGTNVAIRDLAERIRESGGTCHLLGLVSPGGVHSHQDHAVALAKIFDEAGVATAVHVFTDGRDTPPQSAAGYVDQFCAALPANVKVATVCGRYYAMDRDNRWDRVEKAYKALVDAEGSHFTSPSAAIRASYEQGIGDEFIVPAIIGEFRGIQDGDGALCFNFRPDRVREILSALLDPSFSSFARGTQIKFCGAVGLTNYSEKLSSLMETAFPANALHGLLGEIVSQAGLTQLRLAETEKYPHVTYFFNGGREEPYRGEDRILIPSPKVATYDLLPEMSAPELTDRAVDAIASGKYDLIVMNYANGDMVGHSGNLTAAITAVEAVDAALGRLADAVHRVNGCMLITADHGNCEDMYDEESNAPHTAHTTNAVPVLLIGADHYSLRNGRLSDVAPTLLELMRLPKAPEMTGVSLLTPVVRRAEREHEAHPVGKRDGAIYPWRGISSRLADARRDFPRSQIWLARHGETAFNAENRISGQSETSLTEHGRKEAALLKTKLPLSLARVYCSTLERAVETMALALPLSNSYSFHFPSAAEVESVREIVSRHVSSLSSSGPSASCDVFFDARLNEISFGDLEGASRDNLEPYRAEDIDLSPPGGESYRTFAQRVFSAICDALAMGSADGENIAIFAHSGTMRVARSLLRAYGKREELFRLKPPTGALLTLQVSELALPPFWTETPIRAGD